MMGAAVQESVCLQTGCVTHTGIVLTMRMNMDVHVSVKEGEVVKGEGEVEVG